MPAVAGRVPSPRLVHPCRSPGWIFEVSRLRTGSVTRPRGRTAEHRPSWASLLCRSERHRCRPGPSAPVGGVPTASPGIRRVVRTRTPTSTSSPASAFPRRFRHFGPELPLRSRSDLAVSHGLAGFLRRSPGFSPGFSPPFTVAKDSRACCIPLPILGFDAFLVVASGGAGPIARSHCWSRALPVTERDVSPHRIHPSKEPPPRSRSVSPRSFPSRTWLPPRCRPSRRLRCQMRRCCRYRSGAVPQGLAPRRGLYRPSPCSGDERPLLPGPFPLEVILRARFLRPAIGGFGDRTGARPRPALLEIPRSRSVAFACSLRAVAVSGIPARLPPAGGLTRRWTGRRSGADIPRFLRPALSGRSGVESVRSGRFCRALSISGFAPHLSSPPAGWLPILRMLRRGLGLPPWGF